MNPRHIPEGWGKDWFVQISAQRLVILTEVFCGFPQLLQVKAEIVP
jgi:hypothetical protein